MFDAFRGCSGDRIARPRSGSRWFPSTSLGCIVGLAERKNSFAPRAIQGLVQKHTHSLFYECTRDVQVAYVTKYISSPY